MGTHYQSTDIITAGIAIGTGGSVSVNPGDTLVVAKNTQVVSTGNTAISFTDNYRDILVKGDVYGNDLGISAAVVGGNPISNQNITIAETGSVSSASFSAIEMGARTNVLGTGHIMLTNHGTVSTSGDLFAVSMFGTRSATLNNTGTIENTNGHTYGAVSTHGGTTINNSGLIS